MDVGPVIIWWLIITIFGLIGWPLAYSLLRRLPDRGFALMRPVGLLVAGYVLWLGATFRLVQNNLGGIIIAALFVLVIGLLWQRQQGDEPMLAWLKREWRYVLSVEVLFHAVFIGWTVFKAYNPDIQTAGGEKWMEIAFINGTLRSEYFPPQDPWLSGFAISYYYFGYVLLAMATQLTGLLSVVAFNLYIPTLMAMTLAGAFGVTANLVTLYKHATEPTPDDESDDSSLPTLSTLPVLLTGFVGGLFVAVLGNLHGLLEVLHHRALLPDAFWVWLDVRDLKVPPEAAGEGWIPDRFYWWWRGSRVLTDYNLAGNEQEVIDEFPFFSFLLGDVHPHVMALPFVLLAIALALNLLMNPPSEHDADTAPESLGARLLGWLRDGWQTLMQAMGGRLGFGLYALALGGLSFLNTWDFPIYMGVTGLALLVWLHQQRGDWWAILPTGIVSMGLLGVAAILLYFPFYATFQSQAAGILPNLWNPTRLPQFFVFFGPFLVAAMVFLALLAIRYRGWTRYLTPALLITVVAPVLMMGAALAAILTSSPGQAFIEGILNNAEVQAAIGGASLNAILQESLWRRITNPWTFLLLGGLAGLTLALGLGSRADDSQQGMTRAEKFVLILLLAGLGLPLVVEFIFLRDNFGYRMNTIFKFYFQAWVLLALTAAFAVYYVSKHLRGVSMAAWSVTMTALVIGGMFYPVLATMDKANYFRSEEPTLNGIAWIATYQPGDYAAINWLKENNHEGVILEAPGSGYTAYDYVGRVSALTGMPTLLGWGGHQHQWRGTYEEPARREPEIEILFNTTDLRQTQELLDKYNIQYVYIGPLERDRYNPQGLEKFSQIMDVAFEQEGVTIYQRR